MTCGSQPTPTRSPRPSLWLRYSKVAEARAAASWSERGLSRPCQVVCERVRERGREGGRGEGGMGGERMPLILKTLPGCVRVRESVREGERERERSWEGGRAGGREGARERLRERTTLICKAFAG